MKFTSMIKSFYRSLLSIKYRVFISFLVMYAGLIYMAKDYAGSMPADVKASIFDMLCDVCKGLGMVGSYRYIFPIIPVFAFILISMLDFENKTLWLIRHDSRRSIWNKQVLYAVNLSLLFSVAIIFGGYLASGISMGSFENEWVKSGGVIYKLLGAPSNWSAIFNEFASYKILLFTFTSSFLGLCAVGLLICTMKTFLKNQYACILIVLIIVAPVLSGEFSIVLKQMTISLANWMSPITIVKNDVYLILLVLMLYMLGSRIADKKDIIIKV